MVLERKIKDYEASDELLEDRLKESKIYFWVFYIAGILGVFGGAITWTAFDSLDLTLLILAWGILFMFVSIMLLVLCSQQQLYIFINHKVQKIEGKKHGNKKQKQ
jgi:hypothetical protein